MSPTTVRRNRRGARDEKSPRSWQRFGARYATVAAAYDTLSAACRHAGPLDEQSVADIYVGKLSHGDASLRSLSSVPRYSFEGTLLA